MRIWTRKSASIQPRTSLGKSAVAWPHVGATRDGPRPGGLLARGPRHDDHDPGGSLRQRLRGQPRLARQRRAWLWRGQILSKFFFFLFFLKISSNFSKNFINFCIQYSIFQHFSISTHLCKILQKNSAKFCKNFADF